MIRKTGDWEKVTRLIGNLAKEMDKARQQSLKLWSLKAEAIAKSHMSKQDLGWKALEPKTLAQKVRNNKSNNILIATTDYFQAINSWVKDNQALAGVKKVARNRDGEEIEDIAKVHEFGTLNGDIPARPLWQPTFEETMKWYEKSNARPDKIFAKNINDNY